MRLILLNLVVIKNEKTGEFIVTQQKDSCKNTFNYDQLTYRGKPDILFAVLNKGSEQIILGGDFKFETPFFNTSAEITGGLGLGTGRGRIIRNSINATGFYNTSIIGKNISDSIVLPCYTSKYRGNNAYNDNKYDEILLDNEIASLKKARGNFQEYEEYVIDNNLYYCVWQIDEYALLFDEGKAVSK